VDPPLIETEEDPYLESGTDYKKVKISPQKGSPKKWKIEGNPVVLSENW
jgi:hypothetical protein